MKNILAAVIVLIFLIVSVFSIHSGTFAPDNPSCSEGVCVKTQITEPLRLGAPVPVTITVTTDREIPNLGIALFSVAGNALGEEPQSSIAPGSGETPVAKDWVDWSVDADPRLPVSVSGTVLLPSQEGTFDVVGIANTSSLSVTNVVHIHVARDDQALVPSIDKNPIVPSPFPSSVMLTPASLATSAPPLTPLGLVTPLRATVVVSKPIPTSVPRPTLPPYP